MSKDGALSKVVSELNKKFGKQKIRVASDYPAVRRVPLNIPAADYVAGGGLPVNRIIELIGDPSSGKSYIAYRAIAEFQRVDWNTGQCRAVSKVSYKRDRQGVPYPVKWAGKQNAKLKICALVDYEGTYDPVWGAKLGINNSGLLIIQPDSGAEAVDTAEALLYEADISLCVIDSVGVMGDDSELEKSMEDNVMGVNARFWNRSLRKFQAAINSNPETDITLIAINRFYEKIGMVFGDPRVASGGSGLRFAKALSLETRLAGKPRKIKNANGKDVIVGRTVNIYAGKNKTARPYLDAEYYLSFIDDEELGIGVGQTNVNEQLIDLGITLGLVERSGAFYTWDSIRSQGREAFVAAMEASDALDALDQQIKEHAAQ